MIKYTYEIIGELSARRFAAIANIAKGVYVEGMFSWWQSCHVDRHPDVTVVW